MEITIIGIVVIISSIYAFIKDEKLLLNLVIFFSTFTAASIFNISKTVTGIAPIYFCGGLWILKLVIRNKELRKIKKLSIKLFNNKLIRALGIFILVVIISELNLLVFVRKITYTDLNFDLLKIIKFSKSNITQPIYLTFMIVLAIFIVLEVKKKEDILRLIKVFSISCTFAMIWGILQFCLYYLNVEYPDYLFNNNIALAQLFNQMIYGVKRVNSIALEPSTFALNILQFTPIILILWLANYQICENKKKSNYMLITLIFLSLVCGILTTSTTAYLGLGLLILFLTVYILFFSVKNNCISRNKKRIGYLYIIGFMSLLIILLVALKVFKMNPKTLIDAFKDITINKANLTTGHERFNAIRMAIEIFKQSPILGSGWGSFRSLDLVTNLLSNLGLVGILSYLYILFVVVSKCLIYIKSKEVASLIGIMTVMIPTIALMISIPDLIFGYYWMAIALVYNYFDEKEVI